MTEFTCNVYTGSFHSVNCTYNCLKNSFCLTITTHTYRELNSFCLTITIHTLIWSLRSFQRKLCNSQRIALHIKVLAEFDTLWKMSVAQKYDKSQIGTKSMIESYN